MQKIVLRGIGKGHIEIPGQFLVVKIDLAVNDSELLLKQNERIFDAMGITGERKQNLLTLLDQLFTTLTSDVPKATRRREVDAIVRRQFEINGVPSSRTGRDPGTGCG